MNTKGDLLRYEYLPSFPCWFVPPRSPNHNLGGADLILHTIQSRTAYERLHRDGVLQADTSLAEPDFLEAYAWMDEQMRARGLAGEGVLWAWARTTRRDLVSNAKHAPGEVLLTVRIPRERVLLSHFDDWHLVLNRTIDIPRRAGEPIEEWEARFDVGWDDWSRRTHAYSDVPLTEWPSALRTELDESWQSVFDHTMIDDTKYVQATFRELHTHEVVRAVKIFDMSAWRPCRAR